MYSKINLQRDSSKAKNKASEPGHIFVISLKNPHLTKLLSKFYFKNKKLINLEGYG